MIQIHLQVSVWMVRDLWPMWIVLFCIFPCHLIEVNRYIQFLFLCTSKIQLSIHNHSDTLLLCQRLYSLIICSTKCNFIDVLSEYTVCLTSEPLLWFWYCFIILQALFAVLKFYFLFDHILLCVHCFLVNTIVHLWDHWHQLYIAGLRTTISFVIIPPNLSHPSPINFLFFMDIGLSVW